MKKRPSLAVQALHFLLIFSLASPSAWAEDEDSSEEPQAEEFSEEVASEEPEASINGQSVEDFQNEMAEKQGADLNIDASKEGLVKAGVGAISDGGASLKANAENAWNVLSRKTGTVGQLNSSYKAVCKKDSETVKDGKAANGAGGNVDAASMGHKANLCELVKNAVNTAQLERVLEIGWAATSGVCISACASKTGSFGTVNLDALCSLAAQGVDLGGTVGNAVLQKDFGTAAKALGNGLMQASNLGNKFAATKLGSTQLGSKAAEKMGAGAEGYKIKDLKADKSKERSEEAKDESCSAIPKTLLAMIQARFRKKNAIGVGVDTLAGLKSMQMRKDGITFAGFDTELKDVSLKANSKGGSNAGDWARSGAFDDNSGGNACAGAQGNIGLTISCMTSADSNLGQLFSNPDVQRFMNDVGVGQWVDADPSADAIPSELANSMGGMPIEFGPLVDQATQLAANTVEAANSAPTAIAETGANYTQAASRSPASAGAKEESLEDMLKRLMDAQNAGEAKPEDPSFDHVLAFRYARDASGLSEDRGVSIFRRVSYRYQSVGRKDGLFPTNLAPPAGRRSPASAPPPVPGPTVGAGPK